MANQIRLKRGSGSDPSASDLVVGEIAIRTDEGKLFTKKDDGSVAEISGGGIDDGDKGDITVSNSGGTFTVDNGVISTGKLADNAVTVAKLADMPTDRIIGREASGSGNPQFLTASEVRSILNVEDGATADQTASEIKTLLQSDKLTASEIADGQINSAKIVNGTIVNADINASAAIAGSKIADASINASDKLENSSITENKLGSGVVTSAKISDGTIVNADINASASISISKLGTLTANTLIGRRVSNGTPQELTASQVRTIINVENGATADQSASEILTLLKTVDGSGSGLDADTLDGIGSGSFLRADAADFAGSDITFGGGAGAVTVGGGSDIRLTNGSWTGESTKIQHHSNILYIQGGSSGIQLRGSDGGSMALFQNSSTILYDDVNFQGGAGAVTIAANSDIRLSSGSWTGNSTKIQHHNDSLYIQGGTGANDSKAIIFRSSGGSDRFFVNDSGHFIPGADSTYDIGLNGTRIRNGYFDTLYGDGSNLTGVNATTLDSIDSGSFLRSDATDTCSGQITHTNKVIIDHNSSNLLELKPTNGQPWVISINRDDLTQSRVFATNPSSQGVGWAFEHCPYFYNGGSYNKFLTTADEGSGNGLDADTLDGIQGSSFLRSDTSDTFTGQLTVLGRLDIGNGGGNDHEIRIYKADNNVSDHIQFYNGTTRVGEIGVEDSTWLRINQETNKNIYTPRYIRADGGFFVDGTSKGINGSGNFIGGTIAGASDYSSLLRSDTADTASGDITFSGGGGAVTIGANSDIRLQDGNWTGNTVSPKIQAHSNYLYIAGGSNGIIFRENNSNRWIIDGGGHFDPAADSTYDIGASGTRVRVGYFDEVDSAEVRVNNGILETKSTIASSHTLTSGFNAMAVSPTINSGITVTVPSGAVWAIV